MIELTKEELLQKKRDLVEKKAKLDDKINALMSGEQTGDSYEARMIGRKEEIQQFIDWINQILQTS